MQSYHFPILSRPDLLAFRVGGPGLGNLLFPIGRALVGAKRTGGVFVQPTLRQLKLGPILRSEPDKRFYSDVLRHRSLQDWKYRLSILGRLAVDENHIANQSMDGALVEYGGLKNYFHALIDQRDLMIGYLGERVNLQGAINDAYDIAVHVRLGDFSKPSTNNTGSSVRTSMDWYSAAIEQAKKIVGTSDPRIVIFTDGFPREVEAFVKLWRPQFDPGKNAITSMMNMAKARCVVTSRSTFSMWGAFLGKSHAIWERDFDLHPYWPMRPLLDSKL